MKKNKNETNIGAASTVVLKREADRQTDRPRERQRRPTSGERERLTTTTTK